MLDPQRLVEGLTFDDVLLIPGKSDFLPSEAITSTRFSRRVSLAIPISSAAMDTVTESALAIALASFGGIGVLHRNLGIAAQRAEVEKVKRSQSGMIVDPITISPDVVVFEVRELMNEHNISGLPVVNGDGQLVGILTSRDLLFETRDSLPISEIMTPRSRVATAPVGTTLAEARVILHQHRVEKLPVVDANDVLKGLITVRDIQNVTQYPNATKDSLGRLRVAAAVSSTGDFLERAEELVAGGVDVLCIDTAHGHSASVIGALTKLKAQFSNVDVVAGNISTYDGAKALLDAGADGIKVGQGPGSICTTRIVSGTGMPQLTAVHNAARAVAGTDVPVIADGGIKFSGDIAKAIAGGADSVMIGSLFAATEESPGSVVYYQGRMFKNYRGMGSIAAMKQGSSDRYGQSGSDKLVPEGIEGRVPHKGPLGGLVNQLVGGLRAGMGYCGCRTIEDMKARAEFLRISSAGLRESHVHDVFVTKEAPNYQVE